jgi:hypothetical protein
MIRWLPPCPQPPGQRRSVGAAGAGAGAGAGPKIPSIKVAQTDASRRASDKQQGGPAGGQPPGGRTLPLYTVVSPRTRRRIGMLPKPNENELQKIDSLESRARAEPLGLTSRKGLYRALHATGGVGAGLAEEDLTQDEADLRKALTLEESQSPTRKHKLPSGPEHGDGSPAPSPKRLHKAPLMPLHVLAPETGERCSIPPPCDPTPPETPLSQDLDRFAAFRDGHAKHVADRIRELRGEAVKMEEVR